MSIEQDLKATFARHEAETPAPGPVRDQIKIRTAIVRRKRRRAAFASAVAVLTLGIVVPLGVQRLTVTSGKGSGPAPAAATKSAAPIPANGLNVLVLAADRAAGDPAAVARTAVIVHVTADGKHAYLVAVPAIGQRKLSEAGKRVAAQTGLTFSSTVSYSPAVLGAVTDALGGIPYCMPGAGGSDGCAKHGGDDVTALLKSVWDKDSARDETTVNVLISLAYRLAGQSSMRSPAGLNKLLLAAQDNGLTVTGDLATAADKALKIAPGDLIGLAEKAPDQQARASLYAALRGDKMAAWAGGHPEFKVSSQR